MSRKVLGLEPEKSHCTVIVIIGSNWKGILCEYMEQAWHICPSFANFVQECGLYSHASNRFVAMIGRQLCLLHVQVKRSIIVTTLGAKRHTKINWKSSGKFLNWLKSEKEVGNFPWRKITTTTTIKQTKQNKKITNCSDFLQGFRAALHFQWCVPSTTSGQVTWNVKN